jgi:hypothetical protein
MARCGCTRPIEAGVVQFDNTDSGLAATEVQGALDELAADAPIGMEWAYAENASGVEFVLPIANAVAAQIPGMMIEVAPTPHIVWIEWMFHTQLETVGAMLIESELVDVTGAAVVLANSDGAQGAAVLYSGFANRHLGRHRLGPVATTKFLIVRSRLIRDGAGGTASVLNGAAAPVATPSTLSAVLR